MGPPVCVRFSYRRQTSPSPTYMRGGEQVSMLHRPSLYDSHSTRFKERASKSGHANAHILRCEALQKVKRGGYAHRLRLVQRGNRCISRHRGTISLSDLAYNKALIFDPAMISRTAWRIDDAGIGQQSSWLLGAKWNSFQSPRHGRAANGTFSNLTMKMNIISCPSLLWVGKQV